MTYDLYDVILDLLEAGFTIRFKPYFGDDNLYKPFGISLTIRNDKVVSGGNGMLNPLRIRESGEDELVRHMIELEKYAIRMMAEDDNEPSATTGAGPTEQNKSQPRHGNVNLQGVVAQLNNYLMSLDRAGIKIADWDDTDRTLWGFQIKHGRIHYLSVKENVNDGERISESGETTEPADPAES